VVPDPRGEKAAGTFSGGLRKDVWLINRAGADSAAVLVAVRGPVMAAVSMDRIEREQVHKDLDVHYFADYAMFTGAIRQYLAKTLEEAFKADPNDLHRRLCILGLYKEEYAAYEDLGALLDSIIRWNKNELKVPFEGILTYKDAKVALNTLLKRHGITNEDDLMRIINIDRFVPAGWADHFPEGNCKAGLIGLCKYIIHDCRTNQKEYGIDAYNKIKHGLAVFPNGNKYASGLPNCPAIIISNRGRSESNPYLLMAMPMGDSSIEQRAKTIAFVQATSRILAALYVISNYPGHFSASFGVQSDCEVFLSHTMADLKSFFWQVADKYAHEGRSVSPPRSGG
jgi:hypothetical protein